MMVLCAPDSEQHSVALLLASPEVNELNVGESPRQFFNAALLQKNWNNSIGVSMLSQGEEKLVFDPDGTD